MHRAEVTLDLTAVERNVEELVKLADGAALWAVVKANAYGHGAAATAAAAMRAGANGLCVATAGEGTALRKLFPAARIIVLGPVTREEVVQARQARLECVAYNQESIAILGEQVDIHLKMNTGMNRWGWSEPPERLPDRIVGVFSHFARAYSDPRHTEEQTARFLQWSADMPNIPRHIANSAATLRFPSTHLDAVRCGTAILGLSPFEDSTPEELGLRPALRWTSYLAQTRILMPGDSVGYGDSFTAPLRMRMGIVPVGYGDGFSKRLTGSRILVGNTFAPVIGVVSMDAIAVGLERDVPTGTTVTIVGDGITLEDHAKVAGATNLEISTGLTADPRRVRRRFTH
ncbi:alanine racemase [Streptomyces sp. NPDC054796]